MNRFIKDTIPSYSSSYNELIVFYDAPKNGKAITLDNKEQVIMLEPIEGRFGIVMLQRDMTNLDAQRIIDRYKEEAGKLPDLFQCCIVKNNFGSNLFAILIS